LENGKYVMGRRAKTKSELLEIIQEAREILDKKFSKLTPEQMVCSGSMDEWSVKDILAHLVDWEERLNRWYQAGKRGEVPKTPAPGMTWRDLPELNRIGYEKHKDESLEEVFVQYEQTFIKTLALIESMTEDEIFEPEFYEWTGKSSLLSFITANTCSHYAWATRNIRTRLIKRGCPG
jgi:hypothetical protein